MTRPVIALLDSLDLGVTKSRTGATNLVAGLLLDDEGEAVTTAADTSATNSVATDTTPATAAVATIVTPKSSTMPTCTRSTTPFTSTVAVHYLGGT